ncbi:MAG: hypothetical protein A2748_01270 [Candidatus Wildermuthbacteria bacterium RIFCSPHIGHO2_01_FULL_45_20]|uniref:Carbohydrate kinase PfkB domain-containing protein n=1 Tax=Candidatus Wildermuthbacteria bacterium RIFCSPHIGHO2_02_FULL_45_25 TaxID=1802450 RepID=A0A1G2R4T7_9BACT|nr:MAG: hypothetical protein A2748_01270 [Candidatus Wildermuthbacteria bacterium RIFCSPHIGHO2_01_FULL_45_20]OHA67846.1 MAG: hypothetical protein A3C04_02835 [Candidatus Wildermuthbacteria bacterium RIFCSPHIGHO2_02_FULL_45_25]
MFDVFTIGSAVRDIFARSNDVIYKKGSEFPAGEGACFSLDSKLTLDEVNFYVGGGAVNTATTFANQGFKVAPIMTVGNDPEGEYIKKVCAKAKLSLDFVSTDKNHSTSFSFIFSLPSGARTIFRYQGASWFLKPSTIPWSKLNAKWLYVNHLAGESHDILPRLLKTAKKSGMKIAWNPGSTQFERRQEVVPLLAYADVCIVNQEEAALLTGIPYTKQGAIFRKLDELVRGFVIMTKGPDGVEVSDGKMIWSAGILPMDKIVDRTGAGDAFGSGFIAALMRKPDDIEHAIQFASANATGVLTQWGAMNGLLKKRDELFKWGKLEIRKTSL